MPQYNVNRGMQQQMQQQQAAAFGAHEVMEIHEVLTKTIDDINTAELLRPNVRDQRLRQVMDNQVNHLAQDYNNLVNYLHKRGMGQAVPYRTHTNARVKYGLRNPEQVSPNTSMDQLNDQDIASTILGCHKASAIMSTNAALECADLNLRNMVSNSAQSHINMAYETFQLMHERGWYQVPTMQDNTTRTIIDTYQPAEMYQGGPNTQMF